MLRTFGVALSAVTLALVAGAGAASAVDTPAVPSPTSPTPTPTLVCPPALPITGGVAGATTTSVTVSYSIFMSPPCGYDPPIMVSLFASRDDAVQGRDPVAESVSGPERSGNVTIGGLEPDTEYWFRFSDAEGRPDPYFIGGPARTAAASSCGATAVIDSSWASGFVATVTVRNTGSVPLDGWRVSWRWSGDERVQSVWGGVVDAAGRDVTVRNAPYNGTLAPGGTTTFGLLAATSAAPVGIVLTCGR
ncbi:Cellulose binding domain-containing protein [Micromonospora phaseoli]|uniref:Cellulose binding domain-containing protein n=1 Tax=Micromonospora phaseoli TaxID=1144548 RepID=A0A1H6VLL4_9ACTN|nr:cellulose binding domain-containing protein [Micromonospora phaseoli]PZV93603.1 cellulose binding domain-containing protein [Micromonospora phaseoli]GIJ80232.1 hypothetical protein Xph01_46640 [Micromonospora phaseoli]SEJ02587.1 Cellulose binding domain-containing protein [Micromonospora phaseoli]